MKAKILFFDDIVSDLFRSKFPADQLVWDDNWMSSLEEAIRDAGQHAEVSLEIAKSGDIDSWQEVIEKEKPDIILLDLFWPEQAQEKYGDRNRGTDISLEALPKIVESFPSIPVICHTVKPDREIMEKVYNAGAAFFMEKISMAIPEAQTPLIYIIIHFLKTAGKGI